MLERLETSVLQKNVKRVQSLLYLTYLMKFRELRDFRHETIEKTIGLSIPAIVEERLLSLFTERQEGRRPGSFMQKMNNGLKSKLNAYICAMCLHIDSFAVNCSTLAKDLKMPVSKVQDLFKQLGCTSEAVKADSGLVMRVARLSAPLQFPKPPKGARARQ